MRPDSRWDQIVSMLRTERDKAHFAVQEAQDQLAIAQHHLKRCESILRIAEEEEAIDVDEQGRSAVATIIAPDGDDSDSEDGVPTLRWKIRRFLKAHAVPQSAPVIAKAIFEQGGYESYSHAKTNVDAALKRMKDGGDVLRTDDGWALPTSDSKANDLFAA